MIPSPLSRRLLLLVSAVYGIAVAPAGWAAAAPSEPASGIELLQPSGGPVLLTSDSPPVVRYRLASPAETLSWELVDAWGLPEAEGRLERIAAPEGELALPLPPPGQYELRVRAEKDGKLSGSAALRLAVLAPFDLAKVASSPFGVMTHFGHGWNADLLDILARMGAKNLRDGWDWAAVEKEKGEFRFDGHYREAMEKARRLHFEVLHVLAFGNPFYDTTPGIPAWAAAPYTREGFDAYARYCAEFLEHFPEARCVEMWNEYNGGFARGPAAGRASVYTEMLKTAVPAIRQVQPDVTVLGCSTIGVGLNWIEGVFKDGGLAFMDGISIHPYGYDQPPETLIKRIAPLQELIRAFNGGRDKPVWVTEQGYFLIREGEKGNRLPLGEMTQAFYLVRAWTVMLGLGIEKMYWYLGRDDPPFVNMGLVGSEGDARGRYAPKPAYAAYGVLVRQLEGLAFAEREPSPAHVYSYVFRREGLIRRVAWSSAEAGMAWPAGGPVEVTDAMGRKIALHPTGGHVHLHLSGAPCYLEGAITGPPQPSSWAVEAPSELAEGEPLQIGLRLPEPLRPGRSWTLQVGESRQPMRPASENALAATIQRPSMPEMWTPFHVLEDGRPVLAGTFRTLVSAPVTLDRFPRLTAADRCVLTVRNRSRQARGSVAEATLEIDGRILRKKFDVPLEPGGEVALPILVPDTRPFRIYPVKSSVRLSDGTVLSREATVSYNPVPRRTVQVDGDLGDWDFATAIDLDDAPYRKLEAENAGPADLGGRIALAADDEHLYFAARITDDVFFQEYSGANVWRGDNIQVGIAPHMPWLGGEWESSRHELGLTLTPAGPEFFEFSRGGGPVPEAKLAVRREGTTTIYEASLPWAALQGPAPAAEAFSFAFYINDNDAKGRKGYRSWGDIKALQKFQPATVLP